MHIRHRNSINADIACVFNFIRISDDIPGSDICRVGGGFCEGQTWRRVFNGNGLIIRSRRKRSARRGSVRGRRIGDIRSGINIRLRHRISRSESLRIARR